MNYSNDNTDSILENLKEQYMNKAKIDIYLSLKFLDYSKVTDTSRLQKWFVEEAHLCDDKTFCRILAKVKRDIKLEAEIRGVPENTTELLELFIKQNSLTYKFSGMFEMPLTITVDGKTFTGKDIGELEPNNAFVAFNTGRTLNVASLEALLRDISHRHGLNFSRDAIADAIKLWCDAKRHEIKQDIVTQLAYDIRYDRKDEPNNEYKRVARSRFELDDQQTEDFIVASLKEFVYQVKRKAFNLEIDNHIMLVLTGAQGVGKTRFCQEFTSPLCELVIDTDFSQIIDDRNIDIWESAIMRFDEMHYAGKTDVAFIKHAMSSSLLTRRLMRTNSSVKVIQRATFIGTSNKSIQSLLSDSTGMRRFVELRYTKQKDSWLKEPNIDWRLLWNGVNEFGTSPLAPFKQQLSAHQEEITRKSNVQNWAASEECQKDFADVRSFDGWNKLGVLYDAFKKWEEDKDKKAQTSEDRFRIGLWEAIELDDKFEWEMTDKPPRKLNTKKGYRFTNRNWI